MIDATEVDKIFRDSLFLEGTVDMSNAVIVEGVMTTIGFDPNRLESYKDRIGEILEELPLPFHEKTGGGFTFLNACVDREGGGCSGEGKALWSNSCVLDWLRSGFNIVYLGICGRHFQVMCPIS